jgi:cell division septation protein DedD
MNDDKGKVHYQLSITGGQAGAFFLGLLVALCLAFFFGMKTGAASRRAPDAVSRLAAASDIPVPAAEPGESPDVAASGPKKKPTPPEPPLGFDEPPAVKPPVRGETPKEDEAVSAAKTPAPKPTSAPKPAATATHPPKAAAPTPASHAAGAKPSASGEWYVQVLATQKPETADETAKRLKGDGYSSDVSPVPGKPGVFRVRVGPYTDRAAADEAARRVTAKEKWLKGKPIVIPGGK